MSTFYLIPSLLAENSHRELSASLIQHARSLRYFAVENERSARRFIASLKPEQSIQEIDFKVIPTELLAKQIEAILLPLAQGFDMGLISEAGVPCVADPGSELVRAAHIKGFKVKPLVGPSAILLALMASGLNGQAFAFEGYLPIKNEQRKERIKHLARESQTNKQTKIFIETPYRNQSLYEALLESLPADTLLCLAINLTGENEQIILKTVAEWQKSQFELAKAPTMFLFLAS